MSPFSIIKKFGKLLRGGISIKAIFLGLLLGFAIGMIPGFNLTVAILLFLLLILNANVSSALFAFAIGKAMSVALAAVWFNVGYALVHCPGIETLIATLANTPVLAFLDWHIYCVFGGLVAAFALGLPLAWGITRILETIRRRYVKLKENHEHVGKVSQSALSRFFMWAIFGKQKVSMADALKKEDRLFNVPRVAGVCVLTVLIVGGCYLFLNPIARWVVIGSFESMNKAEVSVADFDLSIREGHLVIKDMQVTKRKKPEVNRFSVEEVVIDFSMTDLLRRRLVVSELVCNGVRTNSPRAVPGKVFTKTEDLTAEEKAQEAEEDIFELPKPESAKDIKIYVERYKQISSFFEKFSSKQEDPEAVADKEAEKARRKAVALEAKNYRSMSASELLTDTPAWTIQHISVGDLLVAENAPEIAVEMNHLCSNPSLSQEKFNVQVKYDESKMKDYITKQIRESEAYQEGKQKLTEKINEKLSDKLGEEGGEKLKQGLKSLFNRK